MRTTLTIDESLVRELRKVANIQGLSFKEVVHRALTAGLASLRRRSRPRRSPTPTVRMGHPSGGLDKALQVASELENDEISRKLALRK